MGNRDVSSGQTAEQTLDNILAVPLTDPGETQRWVRSQAPAVFTWDYSLARPGLRKLYEKAKKGQWNATTDIAWSTNVDIERAIHLDQQGFGSGIDPAWYAGTPLEKWGEREWLEFSIESRKWTLSQFLHGEQGALLCTSKITETVPWYDARHVEVFARYLEEKMGGGYPINPHLGMLLCDVMEDSRWDMTYLGMQVMVEGLALAAFGYLHQLTSEPLLKQLLRYVMSDEARHVAFGVLSLKEVYDEMSDAEIRDRQEFAYEASIRMRDRFLQQEVWQYMGVNARDVLPLMLNDPNRALFQRMLFAKIVPNSKKLGLLDRNDRWLRRRFEEMGVIEFENLEDTGEEYDKFELDENL
jgi:hypothetical protein